MIDFEITPWKCYKTYSQKLAYNPEWYYVQKTLQNNALFNFIIGARGVGKTYSTLRFCIEHFLETGRKFIYLRRYDKEVNKVKKTMFNKINADTGWQISANIGQEIKMYLGSPSEENEKERKKHIKVIGYLNSLTKSKILKSSDYDDVDYIIFDEFIIDKGVYRYIDDEVTYFLEYYETVARLRDVVVIFLSNAITHYNPYFLEFNLQKPYGKNWYKKNDFLVEYVENKKYTEKKKQTRFGKIIQGTAYGEYAMENTFLRDNNYFIAKHTDKSENICNIKFKNETIGVWADFDLECIFLSWSHDPYNTKEYRISNENAKPEEKIVNSVRHSHELALLKNYFMLGRLYYENGKIKKYGEDIIRNLKN